MNDFTMLDTSNRLDNGTEMLILFYSIILHWYKMQRKVQIYQYVAENYFRFTFKNPILLLSQKLLFTLFELIYAEISMYRVNRM